MRPAHQHQLQHVSSRRPRAGISATTGALVLLGLAAASQHAHAFLLRPASQPSIIKPQQLSQNKQQQPLTVRSMSVFNTFREEPWFTQDTVHVAEGGEDIVIETRSLQPPPKAEPEEPELQDHGAGAEAVVGGSGGDVVEEELQGAAEGAQGQAGRGQPREYKVGIIVVDHGSRRAEANAALEQVVADFRKVSGYALVEPAHMELAEPSIATAFGRCVEQGATFIVCHPFFLSRGRHVVEDIPTLLEEAASIFPGVEWALSQPLGLQAEIPRLMQLAVSDCMRENNVQSEEHAYGKDGFGL